jgi:hypothetical protein
VVRRRRGSIPKRVRNSRCTVVTELVFSNCRIQNAFCSAYRMTVGSLVTSLKTCERVTFFFLLSPYYRIWFISVAMITKREAAVKKAVSPKRMRVSVATTGQVRCHMSDVTSLRARTRTHTQCPSNCIRTPAVAEKLMYKIYH